MGRLKPIHCPFCGNPRPVAKKYRFESAGGIECAGVLCRSCFAMLCRLPDVRYPQAAAIRAWNRRDGHPAPLNHEGLAPCPCCDSPDAGGVTLIRRWCAFPPLLIDAVRCPGCGLHVLPKYREERPERTFDELRYAWNTRWGPEEWALMRNAVYRAGFDDGMPLRASWDGH